MLQDFNVPPAEEQTQDLSSDDILLSLNQITWAIACPDYSLIYVSPAIESICGCSVSHFLEKPQLWFDIIHRDDFPQVSQWLEQINDAGVSELRYRIIRADGSCLWMHNRAILIRNQAGQAQQIQGISSVLSRPPDPSPDTQSSPQRREPLQAIGEHPAVGAVQSDRNPTEDALRQAQQMLQVVMDNVPQRIFWKDTNLVYLGCNQRQAEAAGLRSPAEIVGKTDYDLPWTPEQAEFYRASDRLVIETNTPSYRIPELQRQADGRQSWLQVHKMPLHNAEGEVIGILGMVEDITDRKIFEDELRLRAQREHSLNQVIQAIRDSLDLTTIFSTAASQTAELLGAVRVCIVKHVPERARWQFMMDYHHQQALPRRVGFTISDRPDGLMAQVKQGTCLLVAADQLHEFSPEFAPLSNDFPGNWLIVPLAVPLALKQKNSGSASLEQADAAIASTIWGCLCLVSSDPEQHWPLSQQPLVNVVADQLAIAIHQSELYQRIWLFNLELEYQVAQKTADLQHALAIEELLKRIIDHVRDSLDEDEILQTVVQELAETLVLDCCDTSLYDLAAGTVHIRQEYVTIDLPRAKGQVLSMVSQPHVFTQLLQGLTCQFSQVIPVDFRPGYLPTVLCCPIISDGQVLGDLWLYRPQFSSFSDIEVRLVEQVVSQLAIAIRQARLYQTSQAQVTELERLNTLKDDFLSTVSHELRTPIANIKMVAQMLDIALAQAKVESPQSKRYLQILHSEAQQEIDLINDLLDLQHLSAGTRPLVITTINVQEWLPHVMEPFELRTRDLNQSLELHLADPLPPLQSDLDSLQRILVELFNNACKYTPAGETIRVAAAATATTMEITVSNTGVEIPPDELPRIFDKFYRILQSDQWKYSGTGLGLALVRELVRHLGGDIQVGSDRNETRFILTLPLEIQNGI